jgi:outer membrane protein
MASRFRLLAFGVAGIGLGLATSAAHAQDAATPDPAVEAFAPTRSLTLGEALSYAHEHQPAIRAALSRVSARMAEAAIPSGQWLPVLAITGQIFAMTANNSTGTYAPSLDMDIPRIGGTSSARRSFSPYASTLIGAGLSQEVFDFGRIEAQRAAGDDLVSVERHRADAARLDVDFGVEESFFSVLAARAIVKASEDAYARSKVHRDLAQHGVGSGLRSPIELTRAEADLARFDVGRVRARGGLTAAQSVFAASIGAADPAIDAAGEAPRIQDMPALGQALTLAQSRDPLLAETISQLRAAQQKTRAVGAELRPDVSLTATLSGRAGGAPPTSGATDSGDGWVPNVPNWDAGLVLSWPLSDGVVVARRDAAQSLEQVRRDEIDVRREQEAAAVRQAFVQVGVARSALEGLGNAVVAARANYAQADARFGAGIGNAVELADAEAIRADSEIQLALGQFEVARARAAFGRAIAEGL